MEAETILIVGKAIGMKAGVRLAVHGNKEPTPGSKRMKRRRTA